MAISNNEEGKKNANLYNEQLHFRARLDHVFLSSLNSWFRATLELAAFSAFLTVFRRPSPRLEKQVGCKEYLGI